VLEKAVYDLLSAHLSDIIGNSFEVRNNSDYVDYYVLSKPDIEVQINNAKEYLDAVTAYIDKLAEGDNK